MKEIEKLNSMKKEIKPLLDLAEKGETLRKCKMIPWGMESDSNNKIMLCTRENIFIVSLRKMCQKKNWLKGDIQMEELIKSYRAASRKKDTLVMDDFTRSFNSRNCPEGPFNGEINANMKFIREAITPLMSYNHTCSNVAKNRIKYINNNDSNIKIKSFSCSKLGLLPENNPILGVLMNTGELFLVGKDKSQLPYKYKIITSVNRLIATYEIVDYLEEIQRFAWSEKFDEAGNVYCILSAVMKERLYVFIFGRSSDFNEVNIKLINKEKIELETCRQLMIADGCQDPKQKTFHIICLHDRNTVISTEFIIESNFKVSTKKVSYTYGEIPFIENIAPFRKYVPEKRTECDCRFYIFNPTRILRVNICDLSRCEEHLTFVPGSIFSASGSTITHSGELFVFQQGYFYQIRPVAENAPVSISTLESLQGVCTTNNKLYYCFSGNYDYKEKDKTNMVFLYSCFDSIGSKDICMALLANISKLIMRTPDGSIEEPPVFYSAINLSDLEYLCRAKPIIYDDLLVYCDSFINCDMRKPLINLEKKKKGSNSKRREKQFHKLEDITKVIENLELDENTALIIFKIIRLHLKLFDRGSFKGEIDMEKRELMALSMEHTLKRIQNSSSMDLEEQNSKYHNLLIISLKSAVEKLKNDFVPTQFRLHDLCPICHENIEWNTCKKDHTFRRCALTGLIIYDQSVYLCKNCDSQMIDPVKGKFSLELLRFSFHLCPICKAKTRKLL